MSLPLVIVKSSLSPSIFSPSSPKVIPTLAGILISSVAVKLMSLPLVIVKSSLSPSIFSPVPKVIPTLAGITTSAVAVKLILLPVIVKLLPSPSIFSPSLPKVRPILAGILISPPPPTPKVISVPSPEINSLVSPNIIFLSIAIKRELSLPTILITSVFDSPLTLNIMSLSETVFLMVISSFNSVIVNSPEPEPEPDPKVILLIANSPGVIDKFPVDEAVASVVPNTNIFSAASQPIKALFPLFDVPVSINIPL